MQRMGTPEDDSAQHWENPDWGKNSVEQAVDLLKTMSPEQRAKVLLEFPADEVVAVAEMLQSIDYTQELS